MKTSTKYLTAVLVVAIATAGVFAWIPYNHGRAKTEVEKLQSENAAWFTNLGLYTASLAAMEPDQVVFREKQAVLSSMPDEVELVVVEDSEVPMLSTKFPNPDSYQVFAGSDKANWKTYGIFKQGGGSHWSRVLSCPLEAKNGNTYRLVMFMEH